MVVVLFGNENFWLAGTVKVPVGSVVIVALAKL